MLLAILGMLFDRDETPDDGSDQPDAQESS